MVRETTFLSIETGNKELVCSFAIPTSIMRSYPSLFSGIQANAVIADDPHTPWDDRSPLGAVIARSFAVNTVEETLRKYEELPNLDTLVARWDLIHKPASRYADKNQFLGSICYTDKHEIALAVNFRNSLFIYRPWFAGESLEHKELKVDAQPNFSEFYDVSAECKTIMRYAMAITETPPSPAAFTAKVFEEVKEAFLSMELSRVPFATAIGKVVIPQSVLIRGLGTAAGENIYCIVPVGAIGDNVVVRNSDGQLAVMNKMPWTIDDYFFDVTEVLHAIQ